MLLLENRKFEIVTPVVTRLDAENLRMPNPGEVILAHEVAVSLDRLDGLGSLNVTNKSSAFVGAFTPWHYDFIHTQGHYTDLGELGVKLAGIKGALPELNQIPKLADDLDVAAQTFTVGKGDLLVFGGNRSEVPILHSFQAVVEPRKSYFLAIQIS